MKKLIAMLLVLTMVLSFAACAKKDAGMSHADYVAADNETEVVVETYVQAHQSWWDNKVTVYCQSPDGAYFLYELACSPLFCISRGVWPDLYVGLYPWQWR